MTAYKKNICPAVAVSADMRSYAQNCTWFYPDNKSIYQYVLLSRVTNTSAVPLVVESGTPKSYQPYYFASMSDTLSSARHNRGSNYTFFDGHVLWLRSDNELLTTLGGYNIPSAFIIPKNAFSSKVYYY